MVDAVAEANHPNTGLLANRATDGGHRIRVIEEYGLGAHFGHVARDRDHLRDHPHRPADAARQSRVADRLIDAVCPRNLDVSLPSGATADGNGCDDIVRSGQDRSTVGGGHDRNGRLLGIQHLADELLYGIERHGVDIDQRKLPSILLASQNNIGHQSLSEHGAPGTNQHEFLARHEPTFGKISEPPFVTVKAWNLQCHAKFCSILFSCMSQGKQT